MVGSGGWEWVGLENYTFALGNADLRSSILRTVLYTVYVTVFSLFLAVGVRYSERAVQGTQVPGRPGDFAPVRFDVRRGGGLSVYVQPTVRVLRFGPDEPGNRHAQTAIQFRGRQVVLDLYRDRACMAVLAVGHVLHLAVMQVIPQDLFKIAKTDRLGCFWSLRACHLAVHPPACADLPGAGDGGGSEGLRHHLLL